MTTRENSHQLRFEATCNVSAGLKWFHFALTDGVPSEPVNQPGGYVHR